MLGLAIVAALVTLGLAAAVARLDRGARQRELEALYFERLLRAHPRARRAGMVATLSEDAQDVTIHVLEVSHGGARHLLDGPVARFRLTAEVVGGALSPTQIGPTKALSAALTARGLSHLGTLLVIADGEGLDGITIGIEAATVTLTGSANAEHVRLAARLAAAIALSPRAILGRIAAARDRSIDDAGTLDLGAGITLRVDRGLRLEGPIAAPAEASSLEALVAARRGEPEHERLLTLARELEPREVEVRPGRLSLVLPLEREAEIGRAIELVEQLARRGGGYRGDGGPSITPAPPAPSPRPPILAAVPAQGPGDDWLTMRLRISLLSPLGEAPCRGELSIEDAGARVPVTTVTFGRSIVGGVIRDVAITASLHRQKGGEQVVQIRRDESHHRERETHRRFFAYQPEHRTVSEASEAEVSPLGPAVLTTHAGGDYRDVPVPNRPTEPSVWTEVHWGADGLLAFMHGDLGPGDLSRFAEDPRFASRTLLRLTGNPRLGPTLLSELAPAWPKGLAELELEKCEVPDTELEVLAHIARAGSLRSLRLSAVGDRGLDALGSSVFLTGLTSLFVESSRASPGALRRFAESPLIEHLEALTLRALGGSSTAPFAAALAARERPLPLRTLDLRYGRLGEGDAHGGRDLAHASCLGSLRELDLGDCRLREGDLLHLSNSQALAALRVLHLDGNWYPSSTHVTTLENRTGLSALAEVVIGQVPHPTDTEEWVDHGVVVGGGPRPLGPKEMAQLGRKLRFRRW